jgi:hypothetical protein
LRAKRFDTERAQAQLELKDPALAATAEGITIADLSLPDIRCFMAMRALSGLPAIQQRKSSDGIAASSRDRQPIPQRLTHCVAPSASGMRSPCSC